MSERETQQPAGQGPSGPADPASGPQPGEGPRPGGPEDVGSKALSDALRLSFTFLKLAMVALIVLYLVQGFFTVGRDEVRIKLRFGRPVQVGRGKGRGRGYVIDAESGWHYCWPWEEWVSIPLSEQTLDVDKEFWYGWQDEEARKARQRLELEAMKAADKGQELGLSVRTDGYLITGDVNIIHLQLRARYAARDDEQGALDYAFRVRSPEELLRRFVIESTIETIASWGVLDVHSKIKEVPPTPQRPGMRRELFAEIQRRVEQKLREFELANGFSAGVRLVAIERISDPCVPEKVKASFDQAQEAKSEKEKLIDEGRREATRLLKEAEAKEAEMLETARAYKNRVIAVAQADAAQIQNLREAYRTPGLAAILRDWHYQRIAAELLGGSSGCMVLHAPPEDGSMQVRVLLRRAPKKAPESAAEQGQQPQQ